MRSKRAARATPTIVLVAFLAGCDPGADDNGSPEQGAPVRLDQYLERPCDMVPDGLPETLRFNRPARVKIDRDIPESECRSIPDYTSEQTIGNIRVELWANVPEFVVEKYGGEYRRAWRVRGYRADFSPPSSDPEPPAACSVDVFLPPKQLVTVGIGIDTKDAYDRCEDVVKKATTMVIEEITQG